MTIENEKIRMKCTPIYSGGKQSGMAIEVNGHIAISLVYEEDIGVVVANLFHKDLDHAVASSEFLFID